MRVVALLALMAASVAPAYAQTAEENAARFRTFYAPAIGAWPAHVVDYDPAGVVEYEVLQLREFRLSVGGRYVRETVQLRDANGRTLEGGVVMHGLNGASGEVRTSGFWGAASDGLFLTSRMEAQGDALRIVGSGTDYPGGVATPVRSEMAWEGEHLVWRTYLTPANGDEYLDHQITYRVARVETLPVAPRG